LAIIDKETHLLGLHISLHKSQLQGLSAAPKTQFTPPMVGNEEIKIVKKFNYPGSLQSTSGQCEDVIFWSMCIASHTLADLDCV